MAIRAKDEMADDSRTGGGTRTRHARSAIEGRAPALAALALFVAMGVAGPAAAQGGNITLADTTASGVKGSGSEPVLSASGERVVFVSSSRMDPADTDTQTDVYFKDLGSGDLKLVSDCSIPQPDGSTLKVAGGLEGEISGDGRFVVFSQECRPRSEGSSGARIWRYAIGTGVIELVSRGSDVGATNSNSGPSISADGSDVAFSSRDRLDAQDQNSFQDVYVRDMTTGFTLASISAAGVVGNGDSIHAALSADGSAVAFDSLATNLDSRDADAFGDVYVKDLVSGELVLASTSDSGVKANRGAQLPSPGTGQLSGDGTKVVFQSQSTNLDPADTRDDWDVYVKDLVTGNVRLASASDSGVKASKETFPDGTLSTQPTISPDGAKVAFFSNATNLDPAASVPGQHVYVKDLASADVTLASASADGTAANSLSVNPALSADGGKVAFTSFATNLHPDDTDGTQDVYVKELSAGPPPADTTAPTIECGSSDGAWHADDVSIACTASDAESGLANPADSSFSLSTSAAPGTEDANASTNSRQVCDQAGNCATAGPIAGNKVDKKDPAVSIVRPGAETYLLNQTVSASYSCADGGSGIASCSGPAADGASIDTASVGTKGFTVSATDGVGNAASQTVTYVVAYDEFLLYDPARPTSRIKLRLHDANGANVSSPATVLTVQSIDGSLSAAGTFTYSRGADGYLYAVDTRGLGSGSHTLEFKAGGDPTVHSVPFKVR